MNTWSIFCNEIYTSKIFDDVKTIRINQSLLKNLATWINVDLWVCPTSNYELKQIRDFFYDWHMYVNLSCTRFVIKHLSNQWSFVKQKYKRLKRNVKIIPKQVESEKVGAIYSWYSQNFNSMNFNLESFDVLKRYQSIQFNCALVGISPPAETHNKKLKYKTQISAKMDTPTPFKNRTEFSIKDHLAFRVLHLHHWSSTKQSIIKYLKCDAKIISKQVETKWNGVINSQNVYLKKNI